MTADDFKLAILTLRRIEMLLSYECCEKIKKNIQE